MPSLGEHQLALFLLTLALVLALARLLGEGARRLGQPEVLGQLVAGVLVGPSVFGLLAPGLHAELFHDPGAGLALSGVSWLGALLVLLVAGLEVDLGLLRTRLRPGLLAAGFAVAPSLAVGYGVARLVFGAGTGGSEFLGIVLSVSAISVVAALLIERGQTRREFAQVLLAAGITSELSAWVLVAVAAAGRHGSPLLAGARALALAVAFFAAAVYLGRPLVDRAMRVVSDASVVTAGPLSLVVVLTLAFAAITEALGLHALLGAFVFGVLLSRAPRSNPALVERLRVITLSVFAPVFFALAGAQVDLRSLASARGVRDTAVLLVAATVVKVALAALGSGLGGLRDARSLLVAVGLNAKGGSDVVVAIVGHQLGLLSTRVYTSYTVVALLTVAFTPALMRWLERRAPATGAEQQRLQAEQASARAYTSTLERALVPVLPGTQAALALDLVARLGLEGTELALGDGDPLDRVAEAAGRHDLTVVSGPLPPGGFALAPPLDALVRRCPSDLLVVLTRDGQLPWPLVGRILAPTNGTVAAQCGADLAAVLATAADSELVLLNVTAPSPEGGHAQSPSAVHLQGVGELVGRLGVRQRSRVRAGPYPGEEIVRELDTGNVDLLVVGCTDRGDGDRPYLGGTVERVLSDCPVPVLLLVIRPPALSGTTN